MARTQYFRRVAPEIREVRDALEDSTKEDGVPHGTPSSLVGTRGLEPLTLCL